MEPWIPMDSMGTHGLDSRLSESKTNGTTHTRGASLIYRIRHRRNLVPPAEANIFKDQL